LQNCFLELKRAKNCGKILSGYRHQDFEFSITKLLDSTETVVLTCVLHNFLRHQSNSCYPSDSEELEVGQSACIPLQDRYNKQHGPQGKEVRDIYICVTSVMKEKQNGKIK
jgi:hypothetical protein